MARPIKKGLFYFPLDIDFLSNRKIKRLLLSHGSEGLSVYLATLCEIYKSEGYYLRLYNELYFDIACILHIPEEKVKTIISYCFEIQLFDPEQMEIHLILTSPGIQERYIEIRKRHKKRSDTLFIYPELMEIIDPKTDVLTEETLVFEEKTLVLPGDNPTKEKEKEKKKEIKNKINTNFLKTIENEKINDNPQSDSARYSELLRMAALATTGRSHA